MVCLLSPEKWDLCPKLDGLPHGKESSRIHSKVKNSADKIVYRTKTSWNLLAVMGPAGCVLANYGNDHQTLMNGLSKYIAYFYW